MNGDDSILTVNTNAKRNMFKYSMATATVNFFPTTKTLQIQGKLACDLRNRLIELHNYSNERNCSDNPAEFQASNFDEALAMGSEFQTPNFVETLEDSQYGLNELESFIDSAVEEASKDHSNFVSNTGYGDEIREIWKVIDVINSKINVILEEKSAFSSTSPTKSPGDLLTIENLSGENDLLKGKLLEMEIELQRTKEENLSLITAIKLLSNNSSEPTKTTEEDNSPRSYNRPLETSNRIEVPQEVNEYQSSSKSFDNQIDDYRAKQKNTYEKIKGSTGHRASKNDIPTNSNDQQPSRTVKYTSTQKPYGSMKEINNTLKEAAKETTQPKQSKKRKKWKSKKIAGTADPIETNTLRDASVPITSENSPVTDSTSAPNTSVIIGDSMLKNIILGWKHGKQVGHRVVVKSFAGATTSDMSHYVKPTIAKNPDEILLHVGTNDVDKLQPQVIAENIVDLAHFITNESVSRVVVSELITRADDSSKEAVKEAWSTRLQHHPSR